MQSAKSFSQADYGARACSTTAGHMPTPNKRVRCTLDQSKHVFAEPILRRRWVALATSGWIQKCRKWHSRIAQFGTCQSLIFNTSGPDAIGHRHTRFTYFLSLSLLIISLFFTINVVSRRLAVSCTRNDYNFNPRKVAAQSKVRTKNKYLSLTPEDWTHRAGLQIRILREAILPMKAGPLLWTRFRVPSTRTSSYETNTLLLGHQPPNPSESQGDQSSARSKSRCRAQYAAYLPLRIQHQQPLSGNLQARRTLPCKATWQEPRLQVPLP
jgi:transposase